MTVGVLDEVFLLNTLNLKTTAEGIADSLLNEGQRPWQTPPDWSGDPLDVEGMADGFDRSEAGEVYGEALQSEEGSAGDAASMKLQSDYLATRERAYRLRHATPIRCALMAASRRAGHGDAGAGVFARVESFAQDLIVAGASGFETG